MSEEEDAEGIQSTHEETRRVDNKAATTTNISERSVRGSCVRPACRFFFSERGCAYGDSCRFSHAKSVSPSDTKGDEGVREKAEREKEREREEKDRTSEIKEREKERERARPRKNRPHVCHYYMSSGCKFGERCKFRHPMRRSGGGRRGGTEEGGTEEGGRGRRREGNEEREESGVDSTQEKRGSDLRELELVREQSHCRPDRENTKEEEEEESNITVLPTTKEMKRGGGGGGRGGGGGGGEGGGVSSPRKGEESAAILELANFPGPSASSKEEEEKEEEEEVEEEEEEEEEEENEEEENEEEEEEGADEEGRRMSMIRE